MIRSLEKIKTLEEYNIAKKDLDYYVSEYKWVSKSENPKLEIEEEIKACSDELHEGMDYDEELDRQRSLQNREKYTQTKKFVEEYAKEKLGLIYPNEVVFKAE